MARTIPFRCETCAAQVQADAATVSLHIHMTDDNRSFVLWTCPQCGPTVWKAWPVVRSALVDVYHAKVVSIPVGADSRRDLGLCRDDLIDVALWDGVLTELASG